MLNVLPSNDVWFQDIPHERPYLFVERAVKM